MPCPYNATVYLLVPERVNRIRHGSPGYLIDHGDQRDGENRDRRDGKRLPAQNRMIGVSFEKLSHRQPCYRATDKDGDQTQSGEITRDHGDNSRHRGSQRFANADLFSPPLEYPARIQ